MMSQTNLRFFSAALFFLFVGCSEGFRSSAPNPSVQEEPKQSPPETPPPVAQPEPQPQPTTPPLPEPGTPLSRICSKLDFRDVQWPSTMSDNEHMYLALALNITGSFEGNLGWKNLAGDFDGQGISMGLMQQNLGQGTLQPLWIETFQKDRSSLSQNLSSAQLLSMQRMLESWLGQAIPAVSKSSVASEAILEEELFPAGDSFNRLDIGYSESDFQAQNARNQASVSWARSEALDSRGQVRSAWRTPLQTIAETPFYRSLQIQTSLKYFLRAQAYLKSFGYQQVRSLLLMYDFVVQNGSIGESHLKIYNDWLQKNPSADEEQKTLALLEARLTTVRPQYRNDVRARKTTIIKGQGVVHQRQRNLPREYCFSPLDLVVKKTESLP